MVREYYEAICQGTEVRENLIALRDSLKDEKNRRAFAYLLGGDFSALCSLLKDEDPKIRKNAALILGELESEDLLPVLFAAYQKEETLFIRADYLKAISGLDYRSLMGKLEKQLEDLRAAEWTKEEWKHRAEEIRILQSMVLRCRGIRRHRFAGMKERPEVILVTNRCQREATAEQIHKGKRTMLNGGIRISGVPLRELLTIRTCSEFLFPIETEPLPAENPEICGARLAKPVSKMTARMLDGEGSVLFRADLRGKADQAQNGNYIRKLTDAMEKESGGGLINSVTDYEVEVRLILRRDGSWAPMLKFSSMMDERFSYRREFVSSSLAPVNAALAMHLALPYLREGAQILDPFCGVGTLLIERNQAIPAGTMYGVDLSGEAIEKARRNTARAGLAIHYINRDFFTFEHEYLFDEVITELPQVTNTKPGPEIRKLYLDFIARISRHLKPDAVLVVYASEPAYLSEACSVVSGYRIEKKYLINEKNGTSVFILKKV